VFGRIRSVFGNSCAILAIEALRLLEFTESTNIISHTCWYLDDMVIGSAPDTTNILTLARELDLAAATALQSTFFIRLDIRD